MRDVTLIEDQGWAEPAASIASTVLSRDAVADDGGGSVYLFTVVIRFLIIRQEEEPGHGMGGLEIALVNVSGQDNGGNYLPWFFSYPYKMQWGARTHSHTHTHTNGFLKLLPFKRNLNNFKLKKKKA